MWEYDPTADVWTPRAVAPASACCLGLTAGRDGRLYAVGSTAAAYDPRGDAWTLGATRPSDDGCCEGAAAPGDGRVYAVGATTTHVYDPAADRWTVLPGPADARHAFGVGAAGGALYAVGGTTDITCVHCYATSAIAEGRPFEGIPLQRQALLPFVPRAALPN
jgi:hypothetical protein